MMIVSWIRERSITAYLLRCQILDITHDNQHRCRLASVPFSNAHG